jgi:hypothetical protein
VLYSSSSDGRVWSDTVDVFPSMPAVRFGCTSDDNASTTYGNGVTSTPFCLDKIHHSSMPFVSLNNRLYAVSSVCRRCGMGYIYPVPWYDLNTTLLRRVIHPAVLSPGGCGSPTPSRACPANSTRWIPAAFGSMFWATNVVPHGYGNLSSAFGIRTADQVRHAHTHTHTHTHTCLLCVCAVINTHIRAPYQRSHAAFLWNTALTRALSHTLTRSDNPYRSARPRRLYRRHARSSLRSGHMSQRDMRAKARRADCVRE